MTDELPFTGIGPAPEHLNEDERRAWDDIVRFSDPGVLRSSDRIYIEITAMQLAHYRDGGQPKKPAAKSMLRKCFITGETAAKVMEPI